MSHINVSESNSLDAATWYVPGLFVGRAKDGRRLLNPQAKQALIARLRDSPGSMAQASQANGIKRELLQRWVSGKTYSHHKRKETAASTASAKPTGLIAVRMIEPRSVAQISVLECELALPKGVLRIKCNAESIGALIEQLQ